MSVTVATNKFSQSNPYAVIVYAWSDRDAQGETSQDVIKSAAKSGRVVDSTWPRGREIRWKTCSQSIIVLRRIVLYYCIALILMIIFLLRLVVKLTNSWFRWWFQCTVAKGPARHLRYTYLHKFTSFVFMSWQTMHLLHYTLAKFSMRSINRDSLHTFYGIHPSFIGCLALSLFKATESCRHNVQSIRPWVFKTILCQVIGGQGDWVVHPGTTKEASTTHEGACVTPAQILLQILWQWIKVLPVHYPWMHTSLFQILFVESASLCSSAFAAVSAFPCLL